MINKAEWERVKGILRDERYESILKIAAFVMDSWAKQSVKGVNEFETLWNVATREAKVEALKEFLDMLERGAFDK